MTPSNDAGTRSDAGAPDGQPDGAGGDAAEEPYGLSGRPANPTCKPPNPSNRPAELLSQTGCLDPQDPREPAAGLIPYDVASPLWSDGAAKRRFFALPDGEAIRVKDCTAQPALCRSIAEGGTPEDDGHFAFPVGTVLVKSFEIDGRMVETRLLVRINQLTWRGFSYEWNEAQTDATLLPDNLDGFKKQIAGVDGGTLTWHFPSRAQCLQCHHVAAGVSLGPTAAQLNGDYTYPSGIRSNQIATLEAIGVLSAPLSKPHQAPLPDPAGVEAPLFERASSYLHANCANCHRPQGSYEGIDLRFGVALADMGVCNEAPEKGDLGVAGALRLVPADPAKSLLSLRMHTTTVDRMPQIGTSVVDVAGVEVIDEWIRSIGSCP